MSFNRADFWLTECKKHLRLAANDWEEAQRTLSPATDSATVEETLTLLIGWIEKTIVMHNSIRQLEKGSACD